MLIRLELRLKPWVPFVANSAQADLLVNMSYVVTVLFSAFHCACAVDRFALSNVWARIYIFTAIPSRCCAVFRRLNFCILCTGVALPLDFGVEFRSRRVFGLGFEHFLRRHNIFHSF